MPVKLCVGDCVLVKTVFENDEEEEEQIVSLPSKQGIGLIKYIGFIHGQKYPMKQYVGIELLEPIAKGHDGTINGYQYFSCPKSYGIHIMITDIIRKLSISEIMIKLKDVITFFKSKVSQYAKALNERDQYIEKLKSTQKHLKLLLKQTTNLNNTLIKTQKQQQKRNSNLAAPKLRNTPTSNESNSSINTSITNQYSPHHGYSQTMNTNVYEMVNIHGKISKDLSPSPSLSFKLTKDSLNTTLKNNELYNEPFMDKILRKTDSNNTSRKQSFIHPNLLSPITPMTPATPTNNPQLITATSIDTMILNHNWKSHDSIRSNATSIATTTPNFATPVGKDNNSNSYASTNTTSTSGATMTTSSSNATTYTNNTTNSNRTMLPIIADVNEPDNNNGNHNRKVFV